ncbi:MAG TPA: hypothetical protein P5340_08035 [Defluviicoccus sp.]|nr:hypothetical protein [Defluviicoccus sp.]
MKIAAISTLFGLALELAGAFLLAAESIGLERIEKWREQWLERASYVLAVPRLERSKQNVIEREFSWLLFVVMLAGTGTGSYIGATISMRIKDISGSDWSVVIGIAVGGLIGYFFQDTVKLCTIHASRFLNEVQVIAGKGTIGLIGFMFLALGFILQAIGALSDIFDKS